VAVTISDVARAAGVSKGAVSFALNGRPGLSDETRIRILDAAATMGWTPSVRAKSLSSSKAYSIGIVFERPPALLSSDTFFPSFIAGVETTLSEREYALVLQFAPDADGGERAYRKLVRAGRVDGVILTDLRDDDSRVGVLLDLGLAAVTLNRPQTPSPFPAVRLDDSEPITAAVEHLIALGHRRIAHVGGTQAFVHGRSRRHAWATALERAGLAADLFVETDFGAASGVAATRELLGRANPPTALVYANDLMAIASLADVQARGMRVPDDLSITGFDNTDFSQYSNPPLTTVATDAVEWGRVSARILLDQLQGSHDGSDVVLAPPRLIVRSSTAPPSQER
jgi:DNA-binding LacI/PurR family transcriptional regulator